ncbi:MAG TPA: Gfo/Idh/MocA family oxidoreductase [Albidovulum sp.]|uniref:Gfo/Idh/MocA family protein n=1 Tax=Albidovulum sp. TaxID=1872424 RepID=UPI002B566778|nr:Gfo/Idh/MocA family oxidoreductase [Defluviimonas sp.]MCP5355624.1 Gfo/Idh/MocA family oxidoreductase [Paracoccaceae bacterium]MCP5376373.1 Gfo/Idh/MocA family oxidoreductase [Paracoccaceae bacterium]HRV61437.1 Gfo/Idh/MocA family oxidoreductase [Albidovulum sp.]
MKTVNWGVLGAAKFAREHMARAIHEAEGARLHSLATSDPAKAEGFRAFCPDLKVHASYDALLADPEVDAVYIPLPNHLHVEWTRKAALAGKHVLTEKPIALAAAEIDGLIALRDASGLLVTEAYMIVHHPQWQRARQLVAEGAIGRILHADAAFSYDNRADPGNIRNRPETGGGSIPDIGVYAYGSVRWTTGAEPVAVRSRIARENGVDVFAQVMADMAGPGGRFTYAAMTSMRLPPRQEVVFQGEGGVMRLTAPFNAGLFGEAQLHLFRPGQPDHVERFPGARQYRNQVEAFGRTIREGAPYPWSLEDARGTQAMIDRVFASDRPLAD